MTIELFTGLAIFALTASLTPGPNNLMLMASGANYGVRATLPHMLGVSIGFTLMVALVGIGLLQLFERWPYSYLLLKVISIAYLLYLAWRIVSASTSQQPGSELASKPLNFIEAAVFQWVNPKAWAMALTAVSAYAGSHSLQAVVLVALIFGAINLPCITLWVMAGRQLRQLLNDARRLRWFNRIMAGLLVLSILPVLAAMD